MSARPFPALLAVAAWLAACATTENGTFKLAVGKGTPYPTKLIAVYPVTLRYEAPAYRSYELAMDEVFATLATGRFMVLGPTEFRVLSYESDSMYASTDLAGKLAPLGLAPGNAAVLRGWVEKRETQSSKEAYDKSGRPKGHVSSADVTYVVHLELLGPDSPQPVIEGQLEVASDPFADHPAADDAPEVRQAARALTQQLFDRLGDRLRTSSQVTALPFEADWVPWDEERFALPNRKALRDELFGQDAISIEASRLTRLAYFAPDLDQKRQSAMLALQPGLWLRKVPSKLKEAGFAPDDLVFRVGDEPVVGPQTLLRWASLTPPGREVAVKVMRQGQIVPLHFPAPER